MSKIEKYEKTVQINDEFMGIGNYTETRYRIVNEQTGEVIDDAQGYGYKSFQKAQKALWYKTNKKEIEKTKNTATRFYKKHKNKLLEKVDILLDIHDLKETGKYNNEKEYWKEMLQILPETEHLGKKVKNSIIELITRDL